MARYLLDTNICIYIARQRPVEVLARFEQAAPGELAMSVITYGELLYGAEKSRSRSQALEVLEALAQAIPVLPMDETVSRHYGEIRAALEQAGTPIGNNDLWIAAHARDQQLTLISNNLREFERVPGLKTENWVNG